MNNKVTDSLREIIIHKFEKIIGNRVILLDCPYHGNIGDLLIWQGECDFFRQTNRKVLKEASSYTFQFPTISKDITICLHGGGNFGDLYREAQEFRLKVLDTYPDNEIVIFPQSVYYSDKSLIQYDVEKFSEHNKLTICARDKASFDFLKERFFQCQVILVPDMAFCLDIDNFLPSKVKDNGDRKVLIKRLDNEFVDTDLSFFQSITQRDWPTFETKYHWTTSLIGIGKRCVKIPNKYLRKRFSNYFDYLMQNKLKQRIIMLGVSFLNEYDIIYTTRLHAMILGLLLSKKIYIIDNLTKKLTEFYYTWLSGCHNIKIFDYKKENH